MDARTEFTRLKGDFINMGNDVRRRTPMGKADAKASNHVLVGLGVGIITAVSGLSVAGTMTAINAMNRQSDEAIEAARISAANSAAQAQQQQQGYPQGGYPQGGYPQNNVPVPGGDDEGDTGVVHTVESEATATPEVTATPEPVAQEPEKWTSDQIGWMQDNQVIYDEYGLPEDQSGNLLDDPTTQVYDPARRAYFFNDDGTPKTPYIDDLPTTRDFDESQHPVVVPQVEDVSGGDPTKPGDKTGDPDDSTKPGNETGNPDNPTNPGNETGNPDDPTQSGSETGNPDNPGQPGGETGNPDDPTKPGNESGDPTNPTGSGNETGNPDDPTQSGSETGNPDDPTQSQTGTGRTRPASEWWYEDNGNLMPGVQLDGNGKPYYVVQSGDALSRLGRRFGYDWHELARVSGLVDDAGNYKGLHPGDIIRFPDHAPTMTPTKDPGSRAPGRG